MEKATLADPTEYNLFLMGYDAREREAIIKFCKQCVAVGAYWFDPVSVVCFLIKPNVDRMMRDLDRVSKAMDLAVGIVYWHRPAIVLVLVILLLVIMRLK